MKDVSIELKVRFTDALRGYQKTFVADEITRKALSSSFGMISLEALKAEVKTEAKAGQKPIVSLRIKLEADVTQECGVSLAPFSHSLAHDLEIDLIERADLTHEVKEIGAKELGLDDLDEPDVIEDGQIDLGQYIIEALSAGYNPFARAPGVEFKEHETAREPSPFAALANWKPKP